MESNYNSIENEVFSTSNNEMNNVPRERVNQYKISNLEETSFNKIEINGSSSTDEQIAMNEMVNITEQQIALHQTVNLAQTDEPKIMSKKEKYITTALLLNMMLAYVSN